MRPPAPATIWPGRLLGKPRAWTVCRLGLEDLVLAYLSGSAAADRRRRPAWEVLR
jgi:hypothetical protein